MSEGRERSPRPLALVQFKVPFRFARDGPEALSVRHGMLRRRKEGS